MIVNVDEKFHIVMRRHYENQVQRHFIGKIDAVMGAIVRATGYIVNVIPPSVNIDELRYETIDRKFLALTDGKDYRLDINEFSTRR